VALTKTCVRDPFTFWGGVRGVPIAGRMHLNSLLRKITSLAALGNLVVVLAIFAAVAAASDSGPEPQRHASSAPSGDGHSPGDHHKWRKHKLDDKSKDKSGDNHTGDGRKPEDNSGRENKTLPGPAKPKQGESMNADPGKGHVTVTLPGAASTIPLQQAGSLPVGSVVDARAGEVTLTTAPREDGAKQSATFSGASFQVLQSKTGRVVTDIRLRGGSFANCGRPAPGSSLFGRAFAASSRSHKSVRSLWGHGKGHFRTSGRNGAATVRGTFWLTQDRCDGTLVRVRRGLVGVRDFKKHKTVAVPAGHSYLARR
jgi:hypothetical protein